MNELSEQQLADLEKYGCVKLKPGQTYDQNERSYEQRMTKPERHLALCKTLNEIYKQKNQNYGDSFHLTFQEEGYAMARIRLSDKLNRFKTLSRNPSLDSADESITDTLLDLANYALMTVLEIRESKGYDDPGGNTINSPQKPICDWNTHHQYPYEGETSTNTTERE